MHRSAEILRCAQDDRVKRFPQYRVYMCRLYIHFMYKDTI